MSLAGNLEDEIDDLHKRVEALEAELTAADDEMDSMEKALDAEKQKVGMYREGMENVRQLLLIAVGADDVPVLYEDKSAADLATDTAILISKLSEQKFKPDAIRGAACGVVRELITDRLIEEAESDGNPADMLSVYNDLEELVVEMTVRSMAQDPSQRRLRDAVDTLIPALRQHGYLDTGMRGSIDRVKVIEGAANLIRRRVAEPEVKSTVRASKSLPNLSAMAAAAQGTKKCPTCRGKGNVNITRGRGNRRGPDWVLCGDCEGKGSVKA